MHVRPPPPPKKEKKDANGRFCHIVLGRPHFPVQGLSFITTKKKKTSGLVKTSFSQMVASGPTFSRFN